LSDLERDVLRAVMLGKKRVREISKLCGIPEFSVNETIRRLIEKGYLTDELIPTGKAYRDLGWINRPALERRALRMLIDVLIIFLILVLIKLILIGG